MLTKFNRSSFFVKSQSAVLNFCHLTTFFSDHHVISGFAKETKKNLFFCQIIMGSPLNNNVPEGRSVLCYKQTLRNHVGPLCMAGTLLLRKIESHFFASYLAGPIETENCTIEFIGSTIQCTAYLSNLFWKFLQRFVFQTQIEKFNWSIHSNF